MKNATLAVTFDSDKLDALVYIMGRKNTDLQAELADYVQKLYEKHVPQVTREYIDDKISRETAAKEKPKRPVRPASPTGSAGSLI